MIYRLELTQHERLETVTALQVQAQRRRNAARRAARGGDGSRARELSAEAGRLSRVAYRLTNSRPMP